MAAPDIKNLLALDVQTRLALVQELWDSIVRDAPGISDLPLTSAEQHELEDRLREDDNEPGAAIPWSEAHARLRKK